MPEALDKQHKYKYVKVLGHLTFTSMNIYYRAPNVLNRCLSHPRKGCPLIIYEGPKVWSVWRGTYVANETFCDHPPTVVNSCWFF